MAVTSVGPALGDCSIDGTKPDAGLCQPTSVAVDTQGRVFVADQNRVRKVTLNAATNDHTVTTVAGQGNLRAAVPGALPARLNGAAGLAATPAGDVAVTDGNENSVYLLRAP